MSSNNDQKLDKMQIDQKIQQIIKMVPAKSRLQLIALNYLQQRKQQLNLDMEQKIREITDEFDQQFQQIDAEQNHIIQGSLIDISLLEQKEEYMNDDELKKFQEESSNLKFGPINKYWYMVMVNCNLLDQQIQFKDQDALESLKNISCNFYPKKFDFTITFEFNPNKYFKNSKLTKTYVMIDAITPIKTIGTEIQWKNNINLTKQQIKKSYKNNTTGMKHDLIECIEAQSFFNFFQSNSWDISIDNQKQAQMMKDYETARIIIDELIPFSLEYYLTSIQKYKLPQKHIDNQQINQQNGDQINIFNDEDQYN